MTSPKLLLGSLFAFALGLGTQRAEAQEVGSPYPPGYSPYLQLINPRGSVTQNYFSLVYPQLRIQENFINLQEQSLNTRRGIAQLPQMETVTKSGKKIGFNTHSKYFNNDKTKFGVNNTTNTNIRPPITNESLLRAYRPRP